MKRHISLILAMILTLLLAGCKEAPPKPVDLEQLLSHSEESLEAYLAGVSRDTIVDAWGEPDDTLSGLSGDIYRIPESDKQLILYYGEDETVTEVKILRQVTDK